VLNKCGEFSQEFAAINEDIASASGDFLQVYLYICTPLIFSNCQYNDLRAVWHIMENVTVINENIRCVIQRRIERKGPKSKFINTPITTPISNIGEKDGKTLLQQLPYSLP
jgi:hypothetical protein